VNELPTISIGHCDDFDLDGAGSADTWQQAQWIPLQRINGKVPYLAHAKILYSRRGIYFLFECEDRRLTNTGLQDFDELFREDVVEVFLWTDQSLPIYFEYELSPLGAELPLLIPNAGGSAMTAWRPWQYTQNRRARKATQIRGGERKPQAAVQGWTAEIFIPTALLGGMPNSRPRPGVKWRGNLCRIDYDTGDPVYWALSPAVGNNFHRYDSFAHFTFE
jgi:hypothetical protein